MIPGGGELSSPSLAFALVAVACLSLRTARAEDETGTLGPWRVGDMAYSQTLTAAGGTSPYTFTLTAGSLPTGLTLSSGGVLSGTPTASGTFPFTVTAADAPV